MPIPDSEVASNKRTVQDFREHGGQITKGPLKGARVLLMTTTGVKSREPRIAPLGYTRDGDRYVVVSSNSGGPTDSAWLANIHANRNVTVEVGAERFPARATVTKGTERRRLFDAHIAALPIFARYESMTEREIPVVVLERADGR